MMRAAGALARSRRRLSPLASLCARPPSGGAAAAAATGALSPAAGARPIFGLVKKWTGVTERDTQISELQAENAAHLETMGDLQGELQRTRGELSAALKRVAALQAEKASITSGRAQAAQQAEERATRAEAAVEAARARLAEIHRLTAPGAEAAAAPPRPAERVLMSSRGAAAAAAAAAGALPVTGPSLLSRALRMTTQTAPDDPPAAPGAASAADSARGAPLRGAGSSASSAAAAAAAAAAPPRWLKRANATALRLRTFPRVLGGRHFARPEHVWTLAARALADTPPGEEVRPAAARAILDLIRLGAPSEWAAACEGTTDDAAATSSDGTAADASSASAALNGIGNGAGGHGAAGEAAAPGPRLRVVESATAVEGRAFALVRSDGVVAAVPSHGRALEALTELPPARDAKALAAERAAAARSADAAADATAADADADAEREGDAGAREEQPARAMTL